MLSLKNLTLKIKDKILLSDINLDIEDNSYFAIIGPNGAGKTLLMESIAGFLKTEGEILLDGEDIIKLPIEKRNIGIVYQSYALFPNMNVFDNIAFSLKMKKETNIEKKIEWIANKLEINSLLKRDIQNLSGGEKQKVAIARALISKPKILMLDEPFSAIDSSFRKKMYEFIKYVHSEFRLTIIHTTHSFEEAITLADEIAIINKGKIEQFGTPDKVFKNPSSEFVAHFIGLENLIPIIIKNDKAYLKGIDLELSSYPKDKKFAILHSEEIILSENPIKSSARFSLEGEIKKIFINDFYSSLKIDIGISITAKITNVSLKKMRLRQGKKIFVTFKESGLRFI